MTPLIELSGVTKTYPGAVALNALTASVSPGSIGLVGANGAGKSTLFRILLGLTQADSGTALVGGIDVSADPVGVRRQVGFMPEHDAMPTDATAADSVATFGELAGLSARDARQRSSDMLDLVGLDEARFRPIGGFSTGMRQRAKLAQALVADPKVVFLDEPTAGLDPGGRQEMLALIRRLAGFGISVMMATHLLDDVQATCDQVLMIDAGQLVAAGPTAELVHTTGLVRLDVAGEGGKVVAALPEHLSAVAEILHDGEVEIPAPDDAAIDAIVAAVASANVPLHSMTNTRTSLDDVFLRGAGSNAPPAPPAATEQGWQ